MKKTFLKKTLALTSAIMLLITLSLTSAANGSVIEDNPNPDEKGSITIEKVINIQDPDNPGQDKLINISGVEYTMFKLAKFEQVGDNQVELNTLLKHQDGNDYNFDFYDYNKDNDIYAEWLYSNISSGSISYKKPAESTPTIGTTDTQGKVLFDNLDAGLYLIYETKRPNNIHKSGPFIVQIPTLENIKETGYDWNYHITLQPKFDCKFETINKNIVISGQDTFFNKDDDILTKAEDFAFDDEIMQQIHVTVPENIENLKTYKITDTLDAGLTTNQIIKVYGKQGTQIVDLSNSNVHTVSKLAGSSFEINFTPSKITGYSEIWVEYIVKLNKEGNVNFGEKGNKNSATLTYSLWENTDDDDENQNIKVPSSTTAIYTYELDLTKTFKGEKDMDKINQLLNDVEFTITKPDTSYSEKINKSNSNITFEDNIIKIKGLDDGQYIITENATNENYSILKEPIIFNIHSVIKGANTYEYKKNTESETLQNGKYFKYKAGHIYYEKIVNDDVIKYENIDTTYWKVDDYKYYEGIVCNSQYTEVERYYLTKNYESADYVENNDGEYFLYEEGKKYYQQYEEDTTKYKEISIDGYSDREYIKFEGNVKTSVSDDQYDDVNKYFRQIKNADFDLVGCCSNIGDLTAKDGIAKIEVINKLTTKVPKTGGIGTYIFTFTGGAIIIVAAIMLFSQRKKSNDSKNK